MPQAHRDPEENLPEWLRALRKRQEEEAAASQPEPPAEEGRTEEPGWLSEIRQRYRTSSLEQDAEAESAALEDTQPRPPGRTESEPIQEPLPEPEEISPFSDSEPVLEEAAPAFPTEEPAPQPAFADDPGDETSQPVVPAFSEDPEALGAEMPGWLESLRPDEGFPLEDERSEAMLPEIGPLPTGPLADLSDALPASEIGQMGKPPEFSTRLEATASQRQHAAVLKELLQTEQQSAAEGQPPPLPARMLGVIISALLFLAVLFPLLSGSQSADRPEPSFFPEAGRLFNNIDVLPAGAPVLLAFELQPARYGEVAPAAAAVMRHLLDRQARLVFISTEETGPALAERLLAEQFANTPAISTGSYTNLGYLSGGVAALRSFISDPRGAVLGTPEREDPWAAAPLEGIQHLRDFALILVVSGDADTTRAWVEQGAIELPGGLFAATSAQAGPLLRPYLHSDPVTLRGLVSGVHGAVIYERLRGQDGLGRQYWDAYSYGLGSMALLILLGGLYSRLLQAQAEVKPAPGGGSHGP